MDPVSTTAAIANSVMMILGILNKRTESKLSQDYKDVIEHLNDAINAKYPNHARSSVILAKERMDAFKLAFYKEIEQQLSK